MTSVPSIATPTGPDDWAIERARIEATLHQLLGILPEHVTPHVTTVSVEQRDGYTVERFEFDNGDPLGGPARRVGGYLVIPDGLTGPAPAVMYYHWHGGDYHLGKEQIWTVNSRGTVVAEEFVSRGYVLCSIDSYAFGDRSGTGPDGPAQRKGEEQVSLCKLNLWYGRTLWGMMLRDDRMAMDYLVSRPEVDSSRIGAAGISMGSTRTWWNMALDERIRCGVGVACLTRYQELIAHGGLHQHGVYYFVPNMLQHFDSEAVVACCAPRALLCLNGDRDGGTPADGVHEIEAAVEPIYAALGASDNFRSVVYEDVGHEWTPTMWVETLLWLEEHLK
jgi:dienelactone hydrolase